MKKLTISIVLLLTITSAFAQSPEKMSYQAVVRQTNNALVANQTVGVQMSILQGSANGSVVYVETQTPSTNVNGLMSLEIGTGTVMSGVFANIDWSAGPYFIKTETDPTGGTNYTISGTSQLLSVPYALHAKSAESITGTITETDPVFSSSLAGSITGADTANWNNHTIDTDTHLDSAGISILGYTAGAHTVDTDTQLDSTGISSLGYVAGAHTINTDTQLDSAGVSAFGYVAGPHADSTSIADMGFVTNSTCGLAIGDTISGGGIIFYLDPSGCHGLVCASTDQSSGIRWHDGTSITTYAYGNGIGAGVGNTSAIGSRQTGCCYASKACYNVFINGFQDGYLPSRYELKLMYQNIGQGNSLGLGNIGGFNASAYWSSTEHGQNIVWFTNFSTGVSNGDLKSRLYRVRAVRTF